MQNNKKGQALVEFVIILPVIIMIVFCLIDFGKIYYTKNNLESTMETVVSMYKKGNTYDQIKGYLNNNIEDVSFEITNENNKYIKFEIGKKVDIFTPGLKLILDDPYYAKTKRILPYE